MTFAGTYTGTETVTVSAPGVPDTTETFAISIAVTSVGGVTITDVDGTQYTGVLTGANFTATGSFTLDPIPDITCTPVTLTYSGTVSGTTISGTFSGSVSCTNTAGLSLTATVSGTFTATRTAAATTSLRMSDSKSAALGAFVREIGRR